MLNSSNFFRKRAPDSRQLCCDFSVYYFVYIHNFVYVRNSSSKNGRKATASKLNCSLIASAPAVSTNFGNFSHFYFTFIAKIVTQLIVASTVPMTQPKVNGNVFSFDYVIKEMVNVAAVQPSSYGCTWEVC